MVLLEIWFTKIDNKVFRKKQGISMDYSCSPTWCNLYLAWFELEYIRKLSKSKKLNEIKEFYHSFIYMDDLAPIDNKIVLN